MTWDGTRGRLTGDLTITDVTHTVTLEIDYLGHTRDPWGGDRAVFSGHGTINREAWGLTWNMPPDSGGLLVSREIGLVLEIEAVRET